MKAIPFQLRMTALVCATAFASAAHASAITLTPGQSFVLNNGSVSVSQVFEQGQQVLNFSNYGGDPDNLGGAVEAFGTLGYQFSANGVLPTYQFSNVYGKDILTSLSYTSPSNSIVLDDITGQIQKLATDGSLTITAPFIPGLQTGGTLTVSNLKFDLINHALTGDVAGARTSTSSGTVLNTYAPVTANDVVLWTFDMANAPQALPVDCWQADEVAFSSSCLNQRGWALNNDGNLVTNFNLSNLSISQQAFELLLTSTGAQTTGGRVIKVVNPVLNSNTGAIVNPEGWGNVQTQLVFQVAGVPEPGTYALMGLGLVGVGFMTRRRLAAAK